MPVSRYRFAWPPPGSSSRPNAASRASCAQRQVRLDGDRVNDNPWRDREKTARHGMDRLIYADKGASSVTGSVILLPTATARTRVVVEVGVAIAVMMGYAALADAAATPRL